MLGLKIIQVCERDPSITLHEILVLQIIEWLSFIYGEYQILRTWYKYMKIVFMRLDALQTKVMISYINSYGDLAP